MFKKTLIKPDGRHLYLYAEHEIVDSTPVNPHHDPISENCELRWHPLRGEWVAYASHRQNRTFLPPKDYSPLAVTKNNDFPTEMPEGNYQVAVFENLFPSLSEKAHLSSELYVDTKPAKGICEVVVFTQNPETSLGNLSLEEIQLVLKVLGDRTKELSKNKNIKYVLPFENRGVEMGVTLHHPHGQIYAYPFIPPIPGQQIKMMKEYHAKHGSGLLSDIIKEEQRDEQRVIIETELTMAFIPAFARYPYETWIAPKRSVPWIFQLEQEELLSLAIVLKTMLQKFDKLWSKPFPYLMALFQAPVDGEKYDEVHLHFEIYPPYRTKDKLKYLAGTELAAGMFVNDALPEEKAKELREVK